MATLSITDYLVIGVLMVISSAIGVYYWLKDRQKSTEVIRNHAIYFVFHAGNIPVGL